MSKTSLLAGTQLKVLVTTTTVGTRTRSTTIPGVIRPAKRDGSFVTFQRVVSVPFTLSKLMGDVLIVGSRLTWQAALLMPIYGDAALLSSPCF